MVENIVKYAIENGRIEFALLIILVFYTLKVNSQREAKYQQTIHDLTNVVQKVEKIENKVDDIDETVNSIKESIIKLTR